MKNMIKCMKNKCMKTLLWNCIVQYFCRTVLFVCLCGSFFLFFKDVKIKKKTYRLTIKTSDGSTGVSMVEYLSGVVDGVM